MIFTDVAYTVVAGWLPGALALAAGFASFAPVPGTVAGRFAARGAIALLITALILPVAGMQPLETAEYGDWTFATKSFALGCALGFSLRGCLAALHAAGELVEHQLGLPTSADDDHGAGDTPIARLYRLTGTAAFLSCGGHRVVLDTLIATLETAATTVHGVDASLAFATQVLSHISWFAIALAGPIVAALVTANLAAAMIARLLPQVSVAPVMLPIHLASGLALVALSLAGLVPGIQHMISWFSG